MGSGTYARTQTKCDGDLALRVSDQHFPLQLASLGHLALFLNIQNVAVDH